MLANARTVGAHATAAIEAIGSPLIKEVRGVGLIAFELVVILRIGCRGRPTGRRPHGGGRAARRRLAQVPSGTHAVRCLPPLNVPLRRSTKRPESSKPSCGISYETPVSIESAVRRRHPQDRRPRR